MFYRFFCEQAKDGPGSSAEAPLTVYTFEDISSPFWEKKCPGVDPHRREQHLGEGEFTDTFGMAKADFNAMPKWKREKLVRSKGLF